MSFSALSSASDVFHRQFQVEHGVAGVVANQPVGHQRGHPRGFFHHIAPPSPPGDPGGSENRRCADGSPRVFGHHALERAIVHGNHPQATAQQLPGPAAGRGAQVHRAQAVVQIALLVFGGQNISNASSQFQRRAAGCVRRHAQAQDAHRPRRAQPQVASASQARCLSEKHMQAQAIRAARQTALVNQRVLQ